MRRAVIALAADAVAAAGTVVVLAALVVAEVRRLLLSCVFTVVSDFVFVCHLHNRVTTVSSKSYARFFLRLGSHFTESRLL